MAQADETGLCFERSILRIAVGLYDARQDERTLVLQKREGVDVEIELSPQEFEQLMRPVAGSGGWQSLLRKLQRQVNSRTLALTLTEADSKRILRYILSYGSGGWQDRLAAAAELPGKAAKRSTRRRNGVAAKR